MAKLAKIQISGIRSFGPYEDNVQQLKFSTPLTLILGQNGCGKTTIIESIKYACTAELPAGTDNGKGFVHDPKMNRSCSTQGQIKLKFTDPRDNDITISRIVEVSQGHSGQMKFSTKSNCLRRVSPQGDIADLNGRCADITSECCQLMNVSPAVLNNVIFCHQENSAWPLDEGKKLKEKFDEIFDAERYKNCVDAFRQLIKSKQEKLKLLSLDVKYKKEKKEQVEKDRRVMQEKEDNLQNLENNIATKNEALVPVKGRINEILELELILSDLQKELTKKEATINGVIEEQNTIKKSLLFEFEGSDNELQNKIASFNSDRRKDETLIREFERKKADIENAQKEITSNIHKLQAQIGKLNEEKNQQDKKSKERTHLLGKAATDLGLDVLTDCEDNEGAKSDLYKIKSELENQEMSLEVMKGEKYIQEADLQNRIDESRVNVTKTEQNISSKMEKSREYVSKLLAINEDLHLVSTSDESLKNITQKLQDVEKSATNLHSSFQEVEESQKIEASKKNIYEMEQNLERLEGDYRILQQNDVTEGRLEAEKKLIAQKQQEVHKIKTRHADKLKQLFGANMPEKNFKNSILSFQSKADATLITLTDKIVKKQKDVTTLEVQRQSQLHIITNTEKELKTKRAQIFQVCKGRDFDEMLQSTYGKKEKLQKDKGQLSSGKIIYEEFIKKFEENSPCCPVCETNFSGKTDLSKKIVLKLRSKVEKVPQELKRVELELKKEEDLYGKLQQLKLVNGEVKTLNDEKLPQLKEQLEKVTKELSDKNSELEVIKAELEDPQNITNIAKSVISDIATLDQNQIDLDRSIKTVESLKQDLVEVDSKKSKFEVEAQIDYLKSEISEERRKVDAKVKRISNHKDRLQKLMQEKNALVERQLKLNHKIQGKSALEAEKNELDEKILQVKKEIETLNTTLTTAKADLNTCVQNKADIVEKNKHEIESERMRILAVTKIIHEIEKLQREIDNYLNEKTDAKLQAASQSLEEYKSSETKLTDTITKVLHAISTKKEDLAKQELNYRNLQSNAVLREKKAFQVKYENEVKVLQIQIGGHNYKTVYEEKNRLINKREHLEKEINTLTGSKASLSDSIEELRQELSKPEFKNAHKIYMSKFYELKITEHAITDLNTYTAALEKAVLDFHRSKMEQINKTIRELWREIYRGNDIDYIEIKAESVGGHSKRRAYSYKVVQVKKGTSLDMRGRCSAGQKVLACLIIRMALAETLSANCGMLSLDEPTTNLDRENVFSLCDALTRIVNTRQSEKNFQLIVITHDEDFINALTRAQGVSHFFKVERNADGLSVIKKQYAH